MIVFDRELNGLLKVNARERWRLLGARCHASRRPTQQEYHSIQKPPVLCCRAHAVVVHHR